MRRSIASLLMATVLAGLILAGPGTVVTGAANPVVSSMSRAGEDVCPEPNDDFQHACSLAEGSDAPGFIARPDDVDAYRFEMPEWDLGLNVYLEDLPIRAATGS